MTIYTGQATPEQLALICTTQRAASADYDAATDAEILEDARNTLCLPGTAAPGALAIEQDGSPFAEALIALLTPAIEPGGAEPAAAAPSVGEALAVFLDTFASGDLAGDIAARLNCGEFDALAKLLRAAGRGEAADLWIAEHATDDDEGDAHHAPGRRCDPVTLTVYSKPSCVQCTMTYRVLDKKGIEYTTVVITTSSAALAYITEELGYSAAPEVVASDEDHWSGFRPDLIEKHTA